MPTSVTIYEVGPRDGLQNDSILLPAGIKAEFVERLVDAGNTVVKTASFVHPKLVPQLADAGEVLRKVTPVPYGRHPVLGVLHVATRMMALGCTELSIGDTIGVATPGQVTAVLDALIASGIPVDSIAVHFHDTYGQALANTLTALRRGITTFDTSAGGLGGCPYASSATGNLVTEDLLWQLHGLGIVTRHRPAEDGRHERLAGQAAWSPQPVRTVTALAG